VGRLIDLEDDILPVASERLRNTFFTNGELYLCGVCALLSTVLECRVVMCTAVLAVRFPTRMASDL